jgi:hypothetical protein
MSDSTAATNGAGNDGARGNGAFGFICHGELFRKVLAMKVRGLHRMRCRSG